VSADKLDFASRVTAVDEAYRRAASVNELMLNVGRRCDMACAHCHLSCSPITTETMSRATMLSSIALAKRIAPRLVDVTGGAPELWPHLRELIGGLTEAGLAVRIRTNLVALSREQCVGLAEFFADSNVSLLASLPGTTAKEVRPQRGESLEASIGMLRELAALGYGSPGGPGIDIAYNPPLGKLPRAERDLSDEFSRRLSPLGVRIGRVRAIANVPVGRFGDGLARCGGYQAYLHRLADAFNPSSVPGLSCRSSVEVAWDGRLYDCDFNLGAGLPTADGPRTLADALADPEALCGRALAFGPHCFACTAGAGSG